jgi:hypothetical protein
VSGASCTKRLLVGALLAGTCWLGAATVAGTAGAQPIANDDPEVAPSLRGTAGGATGAGTAATERAGPLSNPALLLPLILVAGGAVTGAGVVLVRRAAAAPIGVNGQALEPAPAPVADAHSDVAGELGLDGARPSTHRRAGLPRSAPAADLGARAGTQAGGGPDGRLGPDALARRSAGLVDLSGIDGVLGPRPPATPTAVPPPADSPVVARRVREPVAGGEPPAARVRVDVSEPLFPGAPGGGEEAGEPAAASAADAVVALSAGDLRWTGRQDTPAVRTPSRAFEGVTTTDVDTDGAPVDPVEHPAS